MNWNLRDEQEITGLRGGNVAGEQRKSLLGRKKGVCKDPRAARNL